MTDSSPFGADSARYHPLARLRRDVVDRPHEVAFRFIGSAGGTLETPTTLTYREVDERARAVAVELVRRHGAGSRAAIVCPQGVDYVVAFVACLYAGVTAVPLCAPDTPWSVERLSSVLSGAPVDAVLTTVGCAEEVERLCAQWRAPRQEHLTPLLIDRVCDVPAAAWVPPPWTPDGVAYLQYTSGSTSQPRGVRITHRNMAHGVAQVSTGFRMVGTDVSVTWLPLFHDLGLMLGVLGPLGLGISCVMMSPLDFVRSPLTYLRAIDRWRGTITSGPTFNLDLCVDRVAVGDLASLDLSGLRVLGNGGEAVRGASLRRFTEHFATCGFRPEAHTPSYGLAEATLVVTVVPPGTSPRVLVCEQGSLSPGREVTVISDTATGASAGAPSAAVRQDLATTELVSCGVPVEQQVRIVDAGQRPLAERRVGDIWVCGANVSPGYDRQSEAGSQTFGGGPLDEDGGRVEGDWLRTGDLGFLDGGELYVTGRAKDVIIVQGRNHWPTDLELTVERAVPVFRAHRIAAFNAGGGDRDLLVVAAEIDPRRAAARHDLTGPTLERAVRRALMSRHGVDLHALVCVRPGTLPLTSSGKLRRTQCRETYLGGRFPQGPAEPSTP